MSSMHHNSPSNASTETSRPWLKKHHEARRQRTVAIVKATVDRLVREGQTVTIEAICRLSPEVDPQGKGVKKAGVLGNGEAHAYYRQHSSSYQLAHRRNPRLSGSRRRQETSQPLHIHIDPERDVGRVRQRYLQQTKAELVERLLQIEQAYAELAKQQAHLQFALMDMQQQQEGTPQRRSQSKGNSSQERGK